MSSDPFPLAQERLAVVLLWHMHQPEYRVDGEWQLPWTYLHALKGYADMAAHLEAVEAARAVVNFTPVLLEQLQDYARCLQAAVAHNARIPDLLLDSLRALPPAGPPRAAVLVLASRADPGPIADRHPRWRACAERIGRMAQPGLVGDTEARSFLVWTHLVWLGESLRDDPCAQQLLQAGDDFSADDARALLRLIARTLGALLPRYRRLADQNRIELSVTPYQHPLAPLLLDFHAAADTAPDVTLPASPYPGGAERARWHIDEGLRVFESAFGRRPLGCWPAEAALSQDLLALLAQTGFRWTASSASVLHASAAPAGTHPPHPHQFWRSGGQSTLCLFRDDGLSDRMGFVYQHWNASDALNELLLHLERIAAAGPDRRVVLLALDGENPWGWYPDNGIHFVRGLYRRLAEHARLQPALPGALCADPACPAAALPRLRAGSWVAGQLLTWIGHPEKNRAWELLTDAKRRYDACAAPTPALSRQLGVCEASDWFWWPGDVNPTPAVADFDALFRAQLRALYRELGVPAPLRLEHAFSRCVARETDTPAPPAHGGTMRPTEEPAGASPP